MYSDLDKLINSVANRVKTPDEARNLATTVWLAADDAGLTICNLKPLAYNLKCSPNMNAVMEAVRVLNQRSATTSDPKLTYAAIAQALNWERTEFDKLDELLEAIREQELNHTRVPVSRAYICSTGENPVPAGTKIDVLLVDDTELLGVDNPEDRIWDDMEHPRCIKAYRPHVPTRLATVTTTTHTLLHAGELYRDVTILLHTEQLVAWRTADGQEYSARAHQVQLDPDEDGLAAAILSRIAGVEIAPEHMAELRAQMAGGVTHG